MIEFDGDVRIVEPNSPMENQTGLDIVGSARYLETIVVPGSQCVGRRVEQTRHLGKLAKHEAGNMVLTFWLGRSNAGSTRGLQYRQSVSCDA